MNLDKRVDMLTDEQVVELEPIIDFLNKELIMNYKTGESKITSFSIKEAMLIDAYDSVFTKDKNYLSVVDACSEKVLMTNTLHMMLHYTENEPFLVGHYFQRNLKIRKIMDSKK